MSDVGGQWADRAYIGSFTSAGGRGITTASIDAESGALTELHHTDNDVADPSYLTLTEGPGGRYRPGGHLYAVSESDVGGAAAFSLDDRDRPVLLGDPTPVRGGAPRISRSPPATSSPPTTAPAASAHCPYAPTGHSGAPPRSTCTPATARRRPGRKAARTRRRPRPDSAAGCSPSTWAPTPYGSTTCVTPARKGSRCRSTEAVLRPGTGPRHLAFHPDGTTPTSSTSSNRP